VANFKLSATTVQATDQPDTNKIFEYIPIENALAEDGTPIKI